MKAQVAKLLERDPFPTMQTIEQLDKQFIEKNPSPGGSADLLAMTYCLLFLSNA